MSDYIVVAHRLGDIWDNGAMTDWDARELEFNMDFLGEGTYTVKVWKDVLNADKHAADFTQENLEVNSNSNIKVKMAPGRGWVEVIRKI